MANDRVEPKIKEYPNFGELTIGSSDVTKVIVTALCMLDHPLVNQYFLDNKLKLTDRITKTKIFPREGMRLLEGVYHEPKEEQLSLPDTDVPTPASE